MNMKFRKIKKTIKQWLFALFNFKGVYFYTYFSGIFASLGITFIIISFCMGGALLISSIGAAGISAHLEITRREWEEADCPKDEVVIIEDYIAPHIRSLLFYFIVIFIGLTLLILQISMPYFIGLLRRI